MSYLPNMGIENTMVPPTSIDHIFPDQSDTPLDVRIHVYHLPGNSARDNHWDISWRVAVVDDSVIVRRLHLEQAVIGSEKANHLTNWGPVTKNVGKRTLLSPSFTIGTLGLQKRRKMEMIARATQVRAPDGCWNCQDWVVSICEAAIQSGILDKEVVDKALKDAKAVSGLPAATVGE